MEDFKYASYRISELEKLATEQEWKRKHFQYHNTYSVLMYLTMINIVLFGLYRSVKWAIIHWKKM
jgi:hypothetical protein